MPTHAPASDAADTPATAEATPVTPGEPILRWTARAHSIAEIEVELTKIWAAQDMTVETDDGGTARRVAARTSVMNLVVVARRPDEPGAKAVATLRVWSI